MLPFFVPHQALLHATCKCHLPRRGVVPPWGQAEGGGGRQRKHIPTPEIVMDQIGLGVGLMIVTINVEVTPKDGGISTKERLVSGQVLLYCFS